MFSATSRPRRVLAAVLGCAAAAIVSAGGLTLGYAAQAALIDVPSSGEPGRLVLAADPYPAQFLELSPGDPSYWHIGARLEDAAAATLSLQLRKDGQLIEHPRGLTMRVDVCDTLWSGLTAVPTCGSGARPVATVGPSVDPATLPPFELRPLTPTAPQYLLVTLSVEDSAAARADTTLMGLTGEMGIGLTATAIEQMPVAPPETSALPRTGTDASALAAIAAVAAGLMLGGAALRLWQHPQTSRISQKRKLS